MEFRVDRVGRDLGSEAGSYLRLIDFCITQLKAQGPSRTCTESKEEEGQTSIEKSSGVMTSSTFVSDPATSNATFCKVDATVKSTLLQSGRDC